LRRAQAVRRTDKRLLHRILSIVGMSGRSRAEAAMTAKEAAAANIHSTPGEGKFSLDVEFDTPKR
jgi:hypothetical protein